MADEDELPKDFLPEPGQGYEEKEARGSHMTEIESYERLVEGLKMCADAARHLAMHKEALAWSAIADIFDMIRNTTVAMADKEGRHNDGAIGGIRPVYVPEPWGVAILKMYDGLRQCTGAVRQLATYHRMDERWLLVERHLLDLRHKAGVLGGTTSGLQPGMMH